MTHDTYVVGVSYGIDLSEAEVLRLLVASDGGDICLLLFALIDLGALNPRYERKDDGTPVLRFSMMKEGNMAQKRSEIEMEVRGRLFTLEVREGLFGP